MEKKVCSGECKVNYAIHKALLHLCSYNYSTLECFKTIHNLFYYLFSNISEYKRNELAKVWMDTISEKRFPDSHYSKLVYDWIHSIENKDIIGYSTTIIDNKIQDIVQLIKPYLSKHKDTLMIDIGSSDCQLARDVSFLVGMKPISVSIPHGHKTRKDQTEICQHIDQLNYGPHFIRQIHSYSKKVKVILLNHSLHHFGSEKAIQRLLQQCYVLLEKGGILLIRDHDSNNDMFIDLQHIVLEMKYSKDMLFTEYQRYIHKYILSLQSYYFNQSMMKQWCKLIGFTYKTQLKKQTNIKDVCNQEIDISNTIYLCFQKQSKTRKHVH